MGSTLTSCLNEPLSSSPSHEIFNFFFSRDDAIRQSAKSNFINWREIASRSHKLCNLFDSLLNLYSVENILKTMHCKFATRNGDWENTVTVDHIIA